MDKGQDSSESDSEILTRLRKPIDDLVAKYSFNQPLYNRVRLRQVAWQAVDILVNIEDIGALRNNENFKRLVRDTREIGASKKFIEESINLAVKIYQTLKTDYPATYNRYKNVF